MSRPIEGEALDAAGDALLLAPIQKMFDEAKEDHADADEIERLLLAIERMPTHMLPERLGQRNFDRLRRLIQELRRRGNLSRAIAKGPGSKAPKDHEVREISLANDWGRRW